MPDDDQNQDPPTESHEPNDGSQEAILDLSRRHLLRIGGVVLVGTAVGCGDTLTPAVDAGSADGADATGFDGVSDTTTSDVDGDDVTADPATEIGVDVSETGPGDALPDAPDLAEEPDGSTPSQKDPVILLHLSDTHIGGTEFAAPALLCALGQVREAVNPHLTVISGDLVDEGHDEGMWEDYQEITSSVPADVLCEAPGNHDTHNDLGLENYLASTVTGQSVGAPYHIRVVESGTRRVRIVSLNTASGSLRLQNLTGYLEEDQVDEIIEAIDSDPTLVDQTVVVGHHPIGLEGLSVWGTASHLSRLLETTSATAYLFGHIHSYNTFWSEGTFFVQAPTLGKPLQVINPPGFCVISVDDDGPAVRLVEFDWEDTSASVSWPKVLITHPGNADLAGENPVAAELDRNTSGHLLRAVVFGPHPPDDVMFRIDEGEWELMTAVGNRWEAEFTTTESADMLVEVRAESGFDTDTQQIKIKLR